ncbi:hypothetical protein ACVUCS_004531 [Salmonella enterica subsp. enterica]
MKLTSVTAIIFISFGMSSDANTSMTLHAANYKAISLALEKSTLQPPYYLSNIKEDDTKRKLYKINVTLSVKQIGDRVSATIIFINTDNRDYFIHRRLLPIHPDTNEPYFFSPLCQDAFFILMEGIRLEFLPRATNICGYIEDDNNDDLYINRINNSNIKLEWMRLPSGKSVSFNINLNDAYSFVQGEHWYKIRSLRYRIADDRWFSQRSSNKSLFFVTNFHYLVCQKRDKSFYIQNLNKLCESSYTKKQKSMANFMFKFFPSGGKNNNYIDMNSNQVMIKINGDKVKSYHKTKIELLKKRYNEDWEKYLF